MTPTRVSASPAAGAPPTQPVWAELGALLAAERQVRHVEVTAISARLLLSKRQIQALEAGEPGAFHNVRFFTAALRKYAAFLNVAPDVVDAALTRTNGVAPLHLREHSSEDPVRPTPTRRGFAVALALVTMALAAGGYVMWRLQAARTSPAPAPTTARTVTMPIVEPPPSTAAVPPDVPVAAESEAAAAANLGEVGQVPTAGRGDALTWIDTGTYGGVRVTRATWLFLRYPTGKVVERSLREGDAVSFEAAPVYLALGIPDVEITLGDKTVDVTPFIVNGQVRIRASDLAALAARQAARD